MSSDPKAAPASSPATPQVARREKGVRVFTYPKLVFIFPTLVMSLICWLGMWSIKDETRRPSQVDPVKAQIQRDATTEGKMPQATPDFRSTQNMLALTFLAVFALNMLIMTFDFPRFTVIAALLIVTTVVFFLLWLGRMVDWLTPLYRMLDGIYVAANSNFFLGLSLIILAMYAVIFVTRWLDYWEFLPNEILHHHGPWSDLERFPTMNLKFDKEIPDVFEYLLCRAGRLVFHVASEQKSIILDNVMQIDRKEQALKHIMSRLEVRVTSDQEAAQP